MFLLRLTHSFNCGDKKFKSILITLCLTTAALANDYALDFDGTNDYVKTGGVFSDLGVSQPYTISAWIKVSTGETDGDIIWMSSYSAGDGWCLPPLSIDNSKIRAYSWNQTNGGFAAYDTENITTNIWYHAVTTWDATNGLRLFVDGELKSTNSKTYHASGVSNYIWFGYGCCGCVGMQGYFNGAIDDVGIWNTALDADAISAIYNSGTPINLTSNSGNYDEYTDNLIGYYRFSEGSGTTATDASGNGHHGTLYNGPAYSLDVPGLLLTNVDGNWNTAGTWVGGSVPSSTNNVRISHNVTMDVNATVAEIVVDASKTLTCGSYTLTATGASDINGTVTLSTGTFDANGAFDATGGAITFSGAGSLNLAGAVTGLGTMTSNLGTVTYDGTTQTVFSDAYNNLSLSGGTKTLGGNITVNGDLTNNSNAALSMSTYNVSIGGDLTIANGATWTKGSGTVTFNAASNQTLTDNNGTPQNLGTVVVD